MKRSTATGKKEKICFAGSTSFWAAGNGCPVV